MLIVSAGRFHVLARGRHSEARCTGAVGDAKCGAREFGKVFGTTPRARLTHEPDVRKRRAGERGARETRRMKAEETRNPFGVADAPDPDRADVIAFAATVALDGEYAYGEPRR
jgi:hypothetical protein